MNTIKGLGAEVVRCKTVERFDVANRIKDETGAMLVPPFNDIDVMAGQGTIGLEIAQRMPDLDMVVVPVSGGGLIGGIATALKSLAPEIKIYGAEPAALPRYTASLAGCKPVTVEQKATMADALVANRPGDLCCEQVKRYVDAIVAVSDENLLPARSSNCKCGKV